MKFFPFFIAFLVAHLEKPVFPDLSKCVEKLFEYFQETLLGPHPNSKKGWGQVQNEKRYKDDQKEAKTTAQIHVG